MGVTDRWNLRRRSRGCSDRLAKEQGVGTTDQWDQTEVVPPKSVLGGAGTPEENH